MILIICCFFLSSGLASLSPNAIPIIPVILFQSEIQEYSFARQMSRKGEEKYAPKVDKQFYVRHWEMHLHNQAKEAGPSVITQQSPLKFNKFITSKIPQSKTDSRQMYGYFILFIFVVLVLLNYDRTEEKQKDISFDEEEYELSQIKH